MDETKIAYSPITFTELLKKSITKSKPQPLKRTDINQPSTRWRQDDVAKLKRLVETGSDIPELCIKLKRNRRSIYRKLKQLGISVRPSVPDSDLNYIAQNYGLYGAKTVAHQLKITETKVRYVAKSLGLTYKTRNDYNPPLPRNPLPYEMVKRVAFLQRDNPLSIDKVDDCVLLLYKTAGAGTPMLAIHMTDLMEAVEDHFNRRRGVISGACTHGWRK
uniref:hypothetical protein n=1 Tax=Thaumasiovibrio occultus TaxID=1891184 RepID=UPI000B35C4C1|nr:hypothetical protein [Thaumasiovibrio occultus]